MSHPPPEVVHGDNSPSGRNLVTIAETLARIADTLDRIDAKLDSLSKRA